MEIGVVGLGSMGSEMAARLLDRGHGVIVFNRTSEKAKPLVARGARAAGSPAEVARQAEVVITMLSDDDAVRHVVYGEQGVLAGLGPGGVHVCTSTISPVLSTELARAHEIDGQSYVAAPVLGRPEAARQGALIILAAGSEEGIARATPIFEAIGKKTHHIGEAAEKANVVKLGANLMLATLLDALGEVYGLVERYGVEDQTFLDVFNGSMMQSSVLGAYGNKIAKNEFSPAGFSLRLGLKDVDLTLSAAEAKCESMPLATLLRERFLSAVDHGMGGLDWAAVGRQPRFKSAP